MPTRSKKRIHSFRGTRTNGTGNKKNGRGAGNRGGRGNAGLRKHKFTKVTSKMPDYFKKKGFVNHNKTKAVPVIHVYDIERLVSSFADDKNVNKIDTHNFSYDKSKSEFVFRGKILGTGNLYSSVNVKAYAWSKKAEEKIKAVKGLISKLE